MTHKFPTGARVREHPVTLTQVIGPISVVGHHGKLVDKFRYIFHDEEGYEYQWWTTSHLEGVKVCETITASFSISNLSHSHTDIRRLQRCKESKTS